MHIHTGTLYLRNGDYWRQTEDFIEGNTKTLILHPFFFFFFPHPTDSQAISTYGHITTANKI